MTDAALNQWIAEFFRKANPRAWHENPDFVNDPRLTVMLLEKMAHGRLYHDANEWICESDWRFFHNEARRQTVGRAVAEAFALANGLAASELEGK